MNKSPFCYSKCVGFSALLFFVGGKLTQPLAAQPIVPANDGINTQVNPTGDRYDIFGGTTSTDGTNLFHSFEQFNLDANQTANFLATPELRNILGRIIGGDPSIINGLLQITGGTPNLYLMNPAGIVFGQNARLNIPADFTATTATGIGFENGIFDFSDPINAATLNGQPLFFEFPTANPGAIINAGSLSLQENANLTLSGGTVINTGNISAPGGDINLVAVPGSSRLQLSQEGTILRLEIDPPRNPNGDSLGFQVLDLPALLTGPAASVETHLGVSAAGAVQLTSARGTIPNLPGTTIVSGNLDTQNSTGVAGDITVLGENIALLDADLNASGLIPGTIRVGGAYRGEGSLPTAQRTLIDAQTTINSNGIDNNNGGRVIVWADDVTGFAGTINAYGGEGGFVEVSGKETLVFRGFVDVGEGTILLDPRKITISNNPSSPGVNTELPNIFANDFFGQDITINRGDLENLSGAIFLQATDEILLPSNISLNLSNANSLTLAASKLNLRGEIIVDNITLIGDSIDINKLQGSGIAFIETVTSGRDIAIGGTITTPSLDLSVPDLNQINGFQQLVIGRPDGTNSITLRHNSIFNTPTLLRGNNLNGPDRDTTWTFTGANSGTISGFQNSVTFDNVNNIVAGNSQDQFVFNNNTTFNGSIDGGGGTDTLDYSNSNQNLNLNLGSLPASNVEAAIAPAGYNNTLTATNQQNDWQLQGTNAGTVNNFAFRNFNNLVGGNSSDTFTFADQANVQGIIDGGPGFDRVDYTAYTTPVTVDLANNQATGTQGAFNIESAQVPPNPTPTPTPTPTPNKVPNPNGLPSTIPTGITTLPDIATGVDVRSGNSDFRVTSNLDFVPSNEIDSNLNIALANRNRIGQLLDSNDIKDAIVLLDDLYSSAFADHLGQNLQGQRSTYTQIQKKIQEVAAATNTQPAIIYTFRRPQHLDLILVLPSGDPLHYQIEAANSEALEAVIKDFQDNILRPTRRRSTGYLAPAQQLYDWIITPLKADLERSGIDTLLFSLDRGLRTLPLAALHDGEQFIIEDYRISIIPSLYWANFQYTNSRDGKAIAMGISEFSEQPALPAVPAELEAIASDFRSDIFFNDAFTLNNLKQQTQQPAINIIHLATHGQFLPGAANESYIQLWDEKLTLPEMGQLQWGNSGVDLLVLSACRTALGDEEAEYGFAGLGIQTGVDSVIASLWYANDVGTLALMSEFYNRLETNALKSEALRQAQLALIRGQVEIVEDRLIGPFGSIPLPETLDDVGDRDFDHPYYWAGFALIGSPW